MNAELMKQAQDAIDRQRQARLKQAFMPGEAMASADQGGAPPGGGDPSGGGGDPSAGGSAPPGADPSMAGGGGGAPPPAAGGGMDLQSMIQQQVQTALQGMSGGGGAGGAGAAFKPKIDPNVVQLQILKLLAKICDHLQIPIPASDMVVTPTDLQQQAMGGDPSAGGGAGGGSPQGNMMPMDPIQPIQPAVKQSEEEVVDNGVPFHEEEQGLTRLVDKAAAVSLIFQARQRRAA